MRYTAAFLALACSLVVSEADAKTFVFDCVVANTCPSSNNAGKFLSSTFEYNDVTEKFTWTASFDEKNDHVPDGFWIVINNGPEPKNLPNETLAIIYGDGDTERASAYVFDNENKKKSWEDPGTFIETFENSVKFTPSPQGNTLEFEIDASNLNAFSSDPEWQGLQFDDTIGFWVHALSGTQVMFDADGEILDFSYVKNSSFDRHDKTTESHNGGTVPEPSTMLLAASGLIGFGWVNRRRTRRRILSASG